MGLLAAAVSARVLLRRGRNEDARAELGLAQGLGPTFTQALPWLAVQTCLELARARATLYDTEGARSLSMPLRASSGAGRSSGAAAREQQLRPEIASLGPAAGQGSPLTSAELRLLPWLATHLSFREIGARLYVSRNTIKTQAISVYRKLGVSSRSEAIESAEAGSGSSTRTRTACPRGWTRRGALGLLPAQHPRAGIDHDLEPFASRPDDTNTEPELPPPLRMTTSSDRCGAVGAPIARLPARRPLGAPPQERSRPTETARDTVRRATGPDTKKIVCRR